MLERELTSCSSVAAPLLQVLLDFHLRWCSELIIFYKKITFVWPSDADLGRIITTSHPGHHDNILHEESLSTETLKKERFLTNFSAYVPHTHRWRVDLWMRHMDVSTGHLYWPIDQEGGRWSVLLWQGAEDTNTSWLWVGKDFFFGPKCMARTWPTPG